MFKRAKPTLLTALAVGLGIVLSATGCQVSFNPGTTGPGGAGGCTSCQGGAVPITPRPGGPSHLPSNIQQTAYLGENAQGQPIGGPGGQVLPAVPGCATGNCGNGVGDFGPGPIPREINKVSLPPYQVAPPDILYIDTARLVPKPPYNIEPLEQLQIQVTDTLPNQPINGVFTVSPEGSVSLGYGYGNVRVQGMTVEQIQNAIQKHLSNVLRNAQVSVGLAQFRGQQQVRGEHLVRPDGTISLGAYGCVYVAGMTLGQVKCVIEKHLSDYVVNPQVSVDVLSYNSQWYYVIFDGAGYGQQVYRLPVTGNETVLDAVSNLQGLPPQASQRRVWVARPAPCGHWCDQVLMVDWQAITQGGSTCTNYQLFPGDRVYVDSDCFLKTDGYLAKVLAPVERVLGVTLLGTSVYNSFRNNRNNNGGAFIVAN